MSSSVFCALTGCFREFLVKNLRACLVATGDADVVFPPENFRLPFFVKTQRPLVIGIDSAIGIDPCILYRISLFLQ